MSKVAKSFICRGCLNPVTSAVRTSVDIGASAKLEFGGEVVHVGILALQAKGISCFGWEVRQKLRVLEYL